MQENRLKCTLDRRDYLVEVKRMVRDICGPPFDPGQQELVFNVVKLATEVAVNQVQDRVLDVLPHLVNNALVERLQDVGLWDYDKNQMIDIHKPILVVNESLKDNMERMQRQHDEHVANELQGELFSSIKPISDVPVKPTKEFPWTEVSIGGEKRYMYAPVEPETLSGTALPEETIAVTDLGDDPMVHIEPGQDKDGKINGRYL